MSFGAVFVLVTSHLISGPFSSSLVPVAPLPSLLHPFLVVVVIVVVVVVPGVVAIEVVTEVRR